MAATWWVRRASLLVDGGLTDPHLVAVQLRETFRADFTQAVVTSPIARLGYPDLFDGGKIALDACNSRADREWADWINGGYGVCLRRFDANSLVTKTCEVTRNQMISENGTKDRLTQVERLSLLDAIEKLDAVMLPFAPYQRPSGTPGKWIDKLMYKYNFGKISFV